MTLRAEIEAGLSLHVSEMKRCEEKGFYWALLNLTVVLPDLCGALQADDGEAAPSRYRRWCKESRLADADLNPDDWYEIRCIVLHQGRTLPAARCRYGAFRFNNPGGLHKITMLPEDHRLWHSGKSHMHLDVGKMAEEVRSAISHWVSNLEELEGKDAKARRVQNVRHWLPTVARINSPPGGDVGVTSQPGGYGLIMAGLGVVTVPPKPQ